MKKWSTRAFARAGIIAALYAGLTMVFLPFAYGPIQLRPSEALCVLPAIFPESIPALFIGCVVANTLSAYGIYDIIFGSLTTLVAAVLTYLIAKKCSNPFVSAAPSIILNALIIPLVIRLVSQDEAYLATALSIFATQTIFVYGLGVPLYYGILKLKEKTKLF